MDEVAVLIAEDLNLYMSSCLDELLDVYSRITERELSLLLSSGQRREKGGAIVNYAHPAAAATSRCLDDYRVPDGGRDPRGLFFVLDHALESGCYWNT